MEETLMQYIATERSRGVADAEIKKALLEKGWDAGKVGAAFGENVVHATPAAARKGLFAGRVSRREYLFPLLLIFGIEVVFFFGGMTYGGQSNMPSAIEALAIPLLLFINLAVFIFTISLMVRRLHDLGREWYWIFLIFIPFVLPFFSLYLLFFKGEQHANAYGPIPTNSRSIFDVLLAR